MSHDLQIIRQRLDEIGCKLVFVEGALSISCPPENAAEAQSLIEQYTKLMIDDAIKALGNKHIPLYRVDYPGSQDGK